ncbi:MAG: M23 family metallopeptidase [Leptospiraceae bacterium]|nr:M23 family metallopeptidase [Leptospiraceae bacterium]
MLYIGQPKKLKDHNGCRDDLGKPLAEGCVMQSGVSMPLNILGPGVTITTDNRYKNNPKTPHIALDIAAPCGTPIYAQFDGKVQVKEGNTALEKCQNIVVAGDNFEKYQNSGLSDCANTIIVRYSKNITVKYTHLLHSKLTPDGAVIKQVYEHCERWGLKLNSVNISAYTIPVKNGQEIRQGDLIGYIDSSGFSTGSHLHYELKYQNEPKRILDFNWIAHKDEIEEYSRKLKINSGKQ